MKKLIESDVKFIESEHKYINANGKELSGITKMINSLVFPEKYNGVSDEVLAAAAERGTLIHNMCEEFAINGTVQDFMPDEVANFVNLVNQHGIEFGKAEYLVSDGGQNFATMIDLLDKSKNLYDIKTTSTLDEEYLSWQLSCEAVLFEIQNPGVEVGKLFAIWLKNDRCELREIKRYPDEAIEALMVAWVDGTVFDNPMKKIAPIDLGTIEQIRNLETHIVELEETTKELKKQRERLTSGILAIMMDKGVKRWETDNVKITVKSAYQRSGIDTKKLQEEMPEVAKKYEKITTVKESLLITLK